MTTEASEIISAAEAETAPEQGAVLTKRAIYPEVNDRVKGVCIWLGLGFVVLVVLMQQFSGYS